MRLAVFRFVDSGCGPHPRAATGAAPAAEQASHDPPLTGASDAGMGVERCIAYCEIHFVGWQNINKDHLACKQACGFHAEGGADFCDCACRETASGPRIYAACGTGCLEAASLALSGMSIQERPTPGTRSPAKKTVDPAAVAAFTGPCEDDNERITAFFSQLTGGNGANCTEAASLGMCTVDSDRYRQSMQSACPLTCGYCSLARSFTPTTEEQPSTASLDTEASQRPKAGVVVGGVAGLAIVVAVAMLIIRR